MLSAYVRAHPEIRIIFPVMEKYAKLLALYPDLLPGSVIVASPSASIVLRCLDKAKMNDIAASAGLSIGGASAVSTLEDLQSAARRIGGAFVVKPIESGMRLNRAKALIISNENELREVLPRWPDGHERLVIQQYVAGSRINIYFGAFKGHARQALVSRVLRTDSPDGAGYNTEAVSIPMTDRIRTAMDRILHALQ